MGENVENIYKVLFDAIKEGLLVVDKNGKIIKTNITGTSMFGYQKDELIGEDIERLVPESVREAHRRHREKYNHAPITRSMGAMLKLSGVKKDGSTFPVQVSLNPFKGDNNEHYIIALVSDVTERRENEEKLDKLRETLEQKVKDRTSKLRESERLYKSIARNFPTGVISIFNRSYKYLFAEGQGLYELGIESSDLIGLDYLERIDEEAKQQVKEELDEVFKGNPRDFEVKVKDRIYALSAVPLHSDNEEVRKILVVEKNITEQKAISQKMEEALFKERQLAEMKSRFVSMASHEFRTPLTTINSSASLIKKYAEKENYEKVEKHVGRIKIAVQNLTSILNDFLSFEKLESSHVQANNVPCNIAQIVKDTYEDMDLIKKDNQQIIYNGDDEVFLNVDPLLVRNTMLNLLSNAVKYSPEGGKIIISLKENMDSIEISIQDFGIGIPENEQNNLFTRFFRAENATNIEGTGLGLIIVQRYLDLLGGTIDFVSKMGEGTTFFINLPKM